jgi:hypothetical protein
MRILCLLAWAGFAASLTTHVLSWCGIDLSQETPYIWGLHFGLFVAYTPLIVRLQRWPVRQDGHDNDRFYGSMPRWVRPVMVFMFVYVLLNTFVSFLVLPRYNSALLIRLLSGPWMLFYLIPALFYLFNPGCMPTARQDAARRHTARQDKARPQSIPPQDRTGAQGL